MCGLLTSKGSPKRFLDSDIDVKGRQTHSIWQWKYVYMCPGSPLVVRMLHLMVGSLINSFDWKLENNMDPKAMDLDKPLRAIPVIN
ncbi:Cytochrome P450 superfamily [Sesbania bispinosa]|nr:Cytochrome P450 superfamily [Sesbania bispinosa]